LEQTQQKLAEREQNALKVKQEAAEAEKKAEAAKLAEQKAAEQAKLLQAKADEAKKAEQLKKAQQAKKDKEKDKNKEDDIKKLLAAKQATSKAKTDADATASKQQAAQNLAQSQARSSWVDREFAKFVAQIRADVLSNRTLIGSNFDEDLVCEIRIKLQQDGSILAANIVKSSGNEAYDSNSRMAIFKAAPFDMPEDGELNKKLLDIVLVFKQSDSNGEI
jgi:colicin import membrane protein